MKKYLYLILMVAIYLTPFKALCSTGTAKEYPKLPVYWGSINDPGVKILEDNDDYIIIEVNGEYYVIPKK